MILKLQLRFSTFRQSPVERLVEICFNNQWGTLCDDFCSDSNLVCRELGPTGTRKVTYLGYELDCFSLYNIVIFAGAVAYSFASFGRGRGPIWLDDVHCSGTESQLMNCPSNGIRVHNCNHFEDAGVTCQGERATQLHELVLPFFSHPYLLQNLQLQ